MSMTTTWRALSAAAFAFVAAPAFAMGIEVHDAYAISASPTAPSGAAFMVIHNHGGAPDRLIGVESDAAARVELHTHIEDENGVMQMVHVEEGFDLPTDGIIEMARGGKHIMFMGLSDPFEDGEAISVTLIFETAGEITVEVPVDLARMTGDGAHEMDGMSMEPAAHGDHDHGAQMLDQSGMTDAEAIVAVMKVAFDTPENPLTVDPVVIEGANALASWAQGGNGGRALLSKGEMGWQVVLCGGADLRMPAFLEHHGVSAAERLSQAFNAAEDALGSEQVALYSSFEGIVMLSGDGHSH